MPATVRLNQILEITYEKIYKCLRINEKVLLGDDIISIYKGEIEAERD